MATLLVSGCPDPSITMPDLAIPDLAMPDLAPAKFEKTVDSSGGVFKVDPTANPELGGSSVNLPSGALSSPVVLVITQCAASLASAGEKALGPCVEFGPDSVPLAAAATLTVPYDPSLQPAGSDLVLAVVPQQGTRTDRVSPVALFDITGKIATTSFSSLRVRLQVIAKPKPAPTKNVDILFVIDNSANMAAKQRVFFNALSSLTDGLDAAQLNYHLGFTSTYVGTWTAAGTPFPGANLACDSYTGDDGLLQVIACPNISQATLESTNACNALCPDPTFVPNDGKRYISKQGTTTNVKQFMMGGQDIGPLRAARCIGLLGEGGCGIESPLEAARRALDGHNTGNTGFLRSDAVLAVVFLTDEDDCSVQIARRSDNSLTTASCPTADPNAAANCFNLDYRCLARAVQCTEAMNTPGTKTNCVARPNNYLEPLDGYTSFFSSLRAPSRLYLQGLWAPSILDNPTGDATKNGKVVIIHENPMTPLSYTLNRGNTTNAACYNPDPTLTTSAIGFIGRPQLRLSTLLRSLPAASRSEANICDTANYGAMLSGLVTKLAALAGS